MWPDWEPWYVKWDLPTKADSVFRTMNSGQQRERRRAGFYSERNVLCENDNVTFFVIVFNICVV